MSNFHYLWIDDLRVPPSASHAWAKTSEEAIGLLSAEHAAFSHVSFDHDLGGDDTTRRVVLWMCENPSSWPVTASIHTMNPVGRDWLSGMVSRYMPDTRIVPSGAVI